MIGYFFRIKLHYVMCIMCTVVSFACGVMLGVCWGVAGACSGLISFINVERYGVWGVVSVVWLLMMSERCGCLCLSVEGFRSLHTSTSRDAALSPLTLGESMKVALARRVVVLAGSQRSAVSASEGR